MSTAPEDHQTPDHPPRRSGRLRRSGRQLVRLGAVLAAVSLVVTLIGGWATRSMLDHLQTNSAELLDGTATVSLAEGDQRTLYVTGGLVAPGELVPTPVEQITCTITGPGGELPFESLAEQGKAVGIDTALARLEVVGDFTAQETGAHQLDCDGLGVVVAPEVGPASAIARLGALALGSLGTFLGLTMLIIGGVLLLLTRGTPEPEDDEDLEDAPPQEGADEWWEEGAADGAAGAGRDATHGSPSTPRTDPGPDEHELLDEDEYVEVSEEELAAMTDEQIEELVASGALIFVDDEEDAVDQTGEEGSGPSPRGSTSS